METCGSCKKKFVCLFSNKRRESLELLNCPYCFDPTKLKCKKLELSKNVYINCLECHALTIIMPEYLEYPTIECALCLIPLTRDPLPMALQYEGELDMAASSLKNHEFKMISKNSVKKLQDKKLKELKVLDFGLDSGLDFGLGLGDPQKSGDSKDSKESKDDREYKENYNVSNQILGRAKGRREKMRDRRKAIVAMHKTNGYMLFCQEVRPTIDKTGRTSQQVLIIVGEMWRALTEAKRQEYNQRAALMPVQEIKKRKIPKMPSGIKLDIIRALKAGGPDVNSDDVAKTLGVNAMSVRAIKGNLLNGQYANVVAEKGQGQEQDQDDK